MCTSFVKKILTLLIICILINSTLLIGQLKIYRQDIIVKQIGVVGNNSVRIRRDPASGLLYIVENTGNINRVDFKPDGTVGFTTVYKKSDHGLNAPLGIAFGKDGTMFLVGNDSTSQLGTATIVKGVPVTPGSENRVWSLLAKTVLYRYGNVYNHRMSGIVVDPTGNYIYVNSGACTDHGELRDGFRESGLTSIILKLPVNGENIILQDDRDWLRSNGYLFAEGIRNTFDMAYSANLDLFGVENSDDRDDPDELNWLREGRHYGFPWRIGGNNTPQQFTPYNPRTDPLLNPGAWGGGNLYVTYSNDPTYPKPPEGVAFTEPVLSSGPDADKFRDTLTGTVKDASALGVMIPTFTGHRSPDGIVFDRDSVLSPGLRGCAFVISVSNSNLLPALKDTAQDLLQVDLTKKNDNYTARITRLISGFNSPLGIELIGNVLYILETGLEAPNKAPKLWQITLPKSGAVSVQNSTGLPPNFKLNQNYPNPFNPTTTIKYSIPVDPATAGQHAVSVQLKIFDILGREVVTLVNEEKTPGEYQIKFDGTNLSSGVYFYLLHAGDFAETKKMTLIK